MISTKDHRSNKCLRHKRKQIGLPASRLSPLQPHLPKDQAGPSPLWQEAFEALFQPDLLSVAFCFNPTGCHFLTPPSLCSCCSLCLGCPQLCQLKPHPSLGVRANSTSSMKHFSDLPTPPSFLSIQDILSVPLSRD